MGEDLARTIAEVQGALERLRISVQNQADRAETPWVVVSDPSPAPSAPSSAEALTRRVGGSGSSGALSRSDIRAAFPPCPDHCLDLCARLAVAGDFGPAQRARRAWTAGLWAKEVLQGKVPTPDPAPVINLRPCVYIVLRSERLPAPARFSTFGALRAAVGPLENTSTVCHSFPSLAEARVFCIAAEVPFPQAQ